MGVRVPLSAQREPFSRLLFVVPFGAKRRKSTVYHRFAKVRPKPRPETENKPQQTFRWQKGGQSPNRTSENGTATFLAHNALFCSVLPNNKVSLADVLSTLKTVTNMRQETFTILFLMRKGRTKKNGLAAVYARITTGSLRQEFYFPLRGQTRIVEPEKGTDDGYKPPCTEKSMKCSTNSAYRFWTSAPNCWLKVLPPMPRRSRQRYLNPLNNTMMLIAGLTDYVKRRQAEVGVRITQRTAGQIRAAVALSQTVPRPARQSRGHSPSNG